MRKASTNLLGSQDPCPGMPTLDTLASFNPSADNATHAQAHAKAQAYRHHYVCGMHNSSSPMQLGRTKVCTLSKENLGCAWYKREVWFTCRGARGARAEQWRRWCWARSPGEMDIKGLVSAQQCREMHTQENRRRRCTHQPPFPLLPSSPFCHRSLKPHPPHLSHLPLM